MSNRLLNRALFANALFSLVTGAILVVFPQFIVDLMGIGSPLLFRLLGFGPLPLQLCWPAFQTTQPRHSLRAVHKCCAPYGL